MVRSLLSILVTSLLLVGVALFEWTVVDGEFTEFSAELKTLYNKAEEKTANVEDAKAVHCAWEKKKSRLHVWIPHNDIARIDDYLSEAVKLIAEKEYALALPKIEILLHLSKCLPATYFPSLENIL